MRKKVLIFVFTMLCFGIAKAQYEIPPIPENQTSFYDYIELLNKSGARFLEEKLIQVSDSTSTQIVIIIIDSTKGEKILDLATRWGNKWGVGEKDKDNGIILLMAKSDREVAIATGVGIRDKLTDSNAQRVINERIVPQFKKGNYYRGFSDGINGISHFLQGIYKVEKKSEGIISDIGTTWEEDIQRNLPTILFTLVGFIVLFVFRRFVGTGGEDRWDRMDRYDRQQRRLRYGDDDFWDNDFDSDSGSSGSSGGGFGGGSFGGGGASGSW